MALSYSLDLVIRCFYYQRLNSCHFKANHLLQQIKPRAGIKLHKYLGSVREVTML